MFVYFPTRPCIKGIQLCGEDDKMLYLHTLCDIIFDLINSNYTDGNYVTVSMRDVQILTFGEEEVKQNKTLFISSHISQGK